MREDEEMYVLHQKRIDSSNYSKDPIDGHETYQS